MKKILTWCGLLVGLTGAMLTGCNTTAHVEAASGVNFSNYHSFAWSSDLKNGVTSRGTNDIIDNNIKNAVSNELIKNGWVEDQKNPQVLVDYTVMVETSKRTVSDPVYTTPFVNYYYNPWRRRIGSFWYPSALAGYNTYTIPFKEGTLTINMTDATTNKLIWQGYATGDVSHQFTSQEAKQDVKSIFKKFEYPKSGKI